MTQWQTFTLRERTRLVPAGFALREKAPWWARTAWKLLDRFGMLSSQFNEKYEVYRVPSPKKLFEAVMSQVDGLYRLDRPPKEVLIGPETLSEILGDPQIARMMHPITVHGEGYYNYSPFTVPIRIIPQFEGVLVL